MIAQPNFYLCSEENICLPSIRIQAMPQKYRLMILGAGFSRPAGLPLAYELWNEIRETAARFPRDQRAYRFNKDLQRYISFRREAEGEDLTPEAVDFEDFMRFLDVEHYLGLRGGDTWSADGNEGTVVTKHLIGAILARYVNSLEEVPELYLQFARRLEPHDTVISFNYDTLLERALDAVGKPYRLFATRFKEVDQFRGVVDSDREEIVVLKMHGSIDWFDRTNFESRVALHAQIGAPAPSDVIFSNADALDLQRIVDGPRHENDPLKNVYRAKNLKELYRQRLLFLATPRILPPSATKLLYANQLNDFWEGMGDAGLLNFGMAIIGFSLPDHDDYARQILYQLVTNYQRYNLDRDELGRQKGDLAIVDFFPDAVSEVRFRERYRFVDWARTDLSGNGFGLSSLDKVFA
ncbi:MAG: SIR2 family protein [Rhodospirillaceae bacterium]